MNGSSSNGIVDENRERFRVHVTMTFSWVLVYSFFGKMKQRGGSAYLVACNRGASLVLVLVSPSVS